MDFLCVILATAPIAKHLQKAGPKFRKEVLIVCAIDKHINWVMRTKIHRGLHVNFVITIWLSITSKLDSHLSLIGGVNILVSQFPVVHWIAEVVRNQLNHWHRCRVSRALDYSVSEQSKYEWTVARYWERISDHHHVVKMWRFESEIVEHLSVNQVELWAKLLDHWTD